MIGSKKIISNTFITAALLCVNGFIFIFRNYGFEYKQYISIDPLSAKVCDTSCISKWTKPNSNFTTADLNEACKLLQKELNIDSIETEENKLIALGTWLQNELSHQTGTTNDSVNILPPLKQYYCFKDNRHINFDCGNFQTMFSFFCSSIKLPCRNFQNIQIPTDSIARDSHVANEIYLKDYKKWVFTDAFQNHILVKNNNIPLSASEYLDYNIAGGKDTICFVKQLEGRVYIDTVKPTQFKQDYYFNKNYKLFFYKETDLKHVYSISNKIKRYFLPFSWYEIYAPSKKKTNLLFRIKQLAAIALAGWILFLIVPTFQKKNND